MTAAIVNIVSCNGMSELATVTKELWGLAGTEPKVNRVIMDEFCEPLCLLEIKKTLLWMMMRGCIDQWENDGGKRK